MSTESGNGNGNGNGGHVRLVHSATPIDERKRRCVLKLEELLAQAKQGQFVGLCSIMVRGDDTYSLHWVGGEITFIGALKVLERLLIDKVAQTMRVE